MFHTLCFVQDKPEKFPVRCELGEALPVEVEAGLTDQRNFVCDRLSFLPEIAP